MRANGRPLLAIDVVRETSCTVNRASAGTLVLVCALVAPLGLLASDGVSNLRASQRPCTNGVELRNDPAAASTNPWGVGDAGRNWPDRFSTNVRCRIPTSEAPTGMVLIPAGSFTMGDTLDGDLSALPPHTVHVSAFYMDPYEVTKALWDEVRAWANTNGYDLDAVGAGKAANHPVHTVSWYGVVKWCNARSEREGRVPAYYTNAAQTAVYRAGQADVPNDWVKWHTGYRLPTEAEWEKAARGSAVGRRFPWSDADTIAHSRANYYSSSDQAYDVSPTPGYHPTFNDAVYPYTSPVGYFAANGYGLYDMAGNLWEWCWDGYTSYAAAPASDPRSAAAFSWRVLRGGGWDYHGALDWRVADRIAWPPGSGLINFGFRSVVPAGPP
jgi:formylglycine-generating enzyme